MLVGKELIGLSEIVDGTNSLIFLQAFQFAPQNYGNNYIICNGGDKILPSLQ